MGIQQNSVLAKTSAVFYKGRVIGRLTLIDSFLVGDEGRRHWNALCSCGKTTTIRQDYLKKCIREGLGSCGCLQADSARTGNSGRVHGMCATPTWNSWVSMNRRCYDAKYRSYADYGAKGVTVCQEWRDSFEAFYADMGDRPEGQTLDRIKNEFGYSPGNCRWATKLEQARNKTNNVLITVRGRTKAMSEWAALSGIPYDTLKQIPRDTGEVEARIDAAIPACRLRHALHG